MDHVLSTIEDTYNIILDMFIQEQKKKNHKKLSDNSFYDEVKALIDAMNSLRNYLGYSSIKLSEEVKRGLQ